MPGRVLHASGEEFAVDDFLAHSDLRPYRIHHRGEPSRRSQRHSESGLSLDVSSADGDLNAEVADAIKFLVKHESEIQRLQHFPGVTDMRLDFGYYRRAGIVQFDFLSPELIAQAGKLGIGIELSLYPMPGTLADD